MSAARAAALLHENELEFLRSVMLDI